jgi:hypothetical protein
MAQAGSTPAAGGVRCLGSTCRRSVGTNPPLVTQLRHAARKDDAAPQCLDSPERTIWKPRRKADQPHSALMLRAQITLPHFAVSSVVSFLKSAGEPAIAAVANSAKRSFILRVLEPALISR